jgi:hypothetical protein
MCGSLRTSTTVTMGAMIMTVEAIVARVVGMAVSQHGTEERGRWKTHNNQLKFNNNNAVYNSDSDITKCVCVCVSDLQ